jgi:hypothetical protein
MSDVPNATILHTIAGRLRVRVRDCQAYDPNVCRFTTDAERHWMPVAISGYPFSQQINFVHKGRRVEVFVNPEYVRVEVKGELTVGVTSINKANEVRFMDRTQLLVKDDSRWPVFVPRNHDPSNELFPFLASSALHAAVERLLDEKSDSLHVFQGAVVLYFKAPDADDLINKIEILAELVGPFRRRAAAPLA